MILLNDKWSGHLHDQNPSGNEIPFGMAQEDSKIYSFARNQSTVIPALAWSCMTLTTPSGNNSQSVADRIPGKGSNGPETGSQNVLYDIGDHHKPGTG
jgi:hypothetical protein